MTTPSLKTVPVIREAGHGESAGYMFTFGAYGATYVAVIGGSLEDGLEACEEWLDKHAPGLLHTITADDYAAAAKELGIEWPREEHDDLAKKVTQAAEADMTMVGHTTLQHGNCIPSWEWHVRDLDATEIETLLKRFCRAQSCAAELGEHDAILCEECRGALCERVYRALLIERAGLGGPVDSDDGACDVRLQVHGWAGPDWAIHVGDSSYDQDHRGHWGNTGLAFDYTIEQVIGVASELVDQAIDQACQGAPRIDFVNNRGE